MSENTEEITKNAEDFLDNFVKIHLKKDKTRKEEKFSDSFIAVAKAIYEKKEFTRPVNNEGQTETYEITDYTKKIFEPLTEVFKKNDCKSIKDFKDTAQGFFQEENWNSIKEMCRFVTDLSVRNDLGESYLENLYKDFKTQQKTENEDIKKQNKKKSEKETEVANPEIEIIPPIAEEYFKKIKPDLNLTKEVYLNYLFNLTTKINGIPDEKLHMSKTDKELIKPLMEKYKNTDGSKEELRKAFFEFIGENNTVEKQTEIGNFFVKNHKKGLGIIKNIFPYAEKNRDLFVEAINADVFPIMTFCKAPDYIYNPENNHIYNGNTQIALQTNNRIHNITETQYSPLQTLRSLNADINQKYQKTFIIEDLGLNKNGNKVYCVMIPSKAATKKQIKELKEEQKLNLKNEVDQAKLNYKKNMRGLKFKKKFGRDPVYPEPSTPQKPFSGAENLTQIQNTTSETFDIEKAYKVDVHNYIVASLTKTDYVPQTDWTKPENKKALLEFAQNNPEKMISIHNSEFKNIKEEIASNINSKKNTNENTQQDTNTSSKKHTRP